MSGLFAFPVLIFLMILQTTVVKEINLLNGSADLILVWLCAWILHDESQTRWIWFVLGSGLAILVSAIPWFAVIGGYCTILILAKIIRNQLWQSPLISTFLLVMVSSLILYFASYIGLQLRTSAYPFKETLIQVIIPSIFLNLFISIPIYLFARDMFKWLHPLKENQ